LETPHSLVRSLPLTAERASARRSESPAHPFPGAFTDDVDGDVYIEHVLYPPAVKRLQINIEEDLDEALAVEASRRRTSKAALIREFVRDRLGGAADVERSDPMARLVGDIDDDAGDIDAVVYGA